MKALTGHADWVVSVSFSPDGTHVVSGSWDTTIRVWDVRTGKEVMMPFKRHTSKATSVDFSSDGTRIVSGFGNNAIQVWYVRTEAHTSSVIPSDNTSITRRLEALLQSDLGSTLLSDLNGWIQGSHWERILWVLPEWRNFVLWHPCILLIGQPQIQFDLLHYVHGLEWTRCHSKY